MKQWIVTLLIAAVTLGVSVQAANYCDPCCDPCCNYCDPCSCDPCCDPCCGNIELIAGPLYLRPSVCDLNFAVLDERNFIDGGSINSLFALPQGKEYGICPDYDWGFRVGAGYVMDCGCKDARIIYQRLSTNECKHVAAEKSGQAIWITFGQPLHTSSPLVNAEGVVDGIPAWADAKVHVEWDAVDGEFGSREMKGCDLFVRTHVGLHWSDICLRREAVYHGTVTLGDAVATNQAHEMHANSRTWGIGPRAGADVRYSVACGFGIGGHTGLGILAGETRNSMFQNDVQTQSSSMSSSAVQSHHGDVVFDDALNVSQKSHCIVFPEFDASLGVNYLYCCGECFSLFFEFGYEFRTYINALTRTTFNDAGATNSQSCESFNLDGFYLDVKVTF